MKKIILIACLILVCGISNAEDKLIVPQHSIQEKNNYIALLATKYSIPKEAVEATIDNVFLNIFDKVDKGVKDTLSGKEGDFDLEVRPIEPAIQAIAEKYKISPAVVASVFIDYKTLKKAEEIEEDKE